MLVFRSKLNAEAITKGQNISDVFGRKRVAGVRADLVVSSHASDSPSSDLADTTKCRCRDHVPILRWSIHPVTRLIEGHHVEVELANTGLSHHKVPGPGVVTGTINVAGFYEGRAKPGDIDLLDNDVEVLMGSGLFSQQCIHPPSPIDPDPDTQAVEEVQVPMDVGNGHEPVGLSNSGGHPGVGMKSP